nr:MAG TPA: Glycosyltransferase [Caudoviricetes sp.]
MDVAFMFCLKNSFGGAERRIVRVYNEISAENRDFKYDIIIGGCNLKNALIRIEQADCDLSNVNHICAFKSRIMCLLHILFAHKYKTIHFFGAGNYNVVLQLFCKICNKKSIYTICSYREAYNSASRKQMRRMKLQLRLADHVDLLYPSGADFVSRYVKKSRLTITPGTFTNLTLFKPQEKNKTIVYAAARLEDTKDPILFIESINDCADAIRAAGYQVILLGQGKYEEFLHHYVKDHELNDIVYLAGYDKTSRFMPAANVFFSTQKLENYPSQSLAEAAACGCYLIITDVGDSRRCADESFAAFVKPDKEELSQALVRYFALSDGEREDISAKARAFAEANYSIEKSKKYYMEILKKSL